MKKSQSSLWSINAGSFLGIPVRIHLTFFIFLLWIALEGHSGSNNPLRELLFVVAIFGCILLHELGHALVARKFQIKTKDIMLFPFGGIATIVGSPKPEAEFLISIAGPLVNVVIALLILPFISLVEIISGDSFLGRLLVANIFIVIFNLIPALPMDGGRILRAGLALLGLQKPTLIAARIGQGLAILMAIVSIVFGRIDLLIIAALVFLGAVQEYVQDRAKEAVAGFQVKEVMIESKDLVAFSHGTTVSSALSTALRSFQTIFPVTYADEVLGLTDRESLMSAISSGEGEAYVSSVMLREFPKIGPSEPLAKGLEVSETADGMPVVVIDKEQFLGLLIPEKVFEYLFMLGIKQKVDSMPNHDDLHF